MIIWSQVRNRLDAKSAAQGGPFASVLDENGQWFVVWWVGPKTRVPAPSKEKGVRWVERFAASRLHELGRAAATPGVGPGGAGGYVEPTPEERARYDAFSATYVPRQRTRKARR
jgi:hypothetical protein